tara:strand:- start:54 stop:185 length:132 start_codon:yes stop_codon:yes gene_type:complete
VILRVGVPPPLEGNSPSELQKRRRLNTSAKELLPKRRRERSKL